ncbi:MAG: NADH-quinone oxidoreductase subunit NuoE [Candidatus Thermoplasmatota archaeon]|nr:NADH-quinone oxidoreductase subunit NuoE [Candidatus Thermoplasmatota archaeon]
MVERTSLSGDENFVAPCSELDSIINKYDSKKEFLITILQEIQEKYNYLPKNTLIYVSEKLNVPLIQVYSVATFYKTFSLKPRGKHIINACVGTACHVRGGRRIVDEIQRKLNINAGETTPDKLFTLETVRCLGACALGPVVVVDGEYHGQMTTNKVDALLQKYSAQEENA